MEIYRNIVIYTQLGDLVNEIVQCIQNSFDMKMPVNEILPEIRGDYIWIWRNQDNRVVGFCSIIFGTPNDLIDDCVASNKSGCYLSAATITKDAQGNGLYKQMTRTRLEIAIEAGLDLIFTQTQNPRIEEGIMSALNEQIEKGSIHQFTIERVLMKGAYGRMLTEEIPKARFIKYSDLDYQNGDAYILLFHLKYE